MKKEWNDEYRVRTQADLTRRTKINEPDYPIKIKWKYPIDTMHYSSTDIVSSGWCMDSNSSFYLEIENPLETGFIKEMLEPCLKWMKEHGALDDETIRYNFRELVRHSNIK